MRHLPGSSDAAGSARLSGLEADELRQAQSAEEAWAEQAPQHARRGPLRGPSLPPALLYALNPPRRRWAHVGSDPTAGAGMAGKGLMGRAPKRNPHGRATPSPSPSAVRAQNHPGVIVGSVPSMTAIDPSQHGTREKNVSRRKWTHAVSLRAAYCVLKRTGCWPTTGVSRHCGEDTAGAGGHV